jgi:hypothetical protein
MTQNQQQQQMHRRMFYCKSSIETKLLFLAMMNSYNDLMMPNSNGPPLQQDYHQYSNNNPLDLPYSSDLFMSPPSSMGQQPVQNRHMNIMQQGPSAHPQATMHQVYIEKIIANQNNMIIILSILFIRCFRLYCQIHSD